MTPACRASRWRVLPAPRGCTRSAWGEAPACIRASATAWCCDFVDLSQLSLCTLPSLFGMPRDLDLQGEDASLAHRTWSRITLDCPGFEVEAGAITLSEIQHRAARFDPLGLRVDRDLMAISANAWESLGKQGLALHFEKTPGRLCEVLVLAHGARGKRWQVSVDGAEAERFSTIEEAVQAVDYEVERHGRPACVSARDGAAWRKAAVPQQLQAALPPVRTGRRATTLGEAMRLAVWAKVVRPTSRRARGGDDLRRAAHSPPRPHRHATPSLRLATNGGSGQSRRAQARLSSAARPR